LGSPRNQGRLGVSYLPSRNGPQFRVQSKALETGKIEREEWIVETRKVDEARAEEFAGKMVGVLNDAMLALMSSIGHQTGLFDTMAEMPPSTSEEIGSAADLNERYVREWLGAMVVGGVLEYDPAAKTYKHRSEAARRRHLQQLLHSQKGLAGSVA
jgi:hypothetical protein